MKELLELERQFQRAKYLTFSVIGGCLTIALAAVILSLNYADNFSKRIFILNRSVALEAFSGNIMDNRAAEAKHHVARFHELFFTVSPDPISIETNVKKAFFLCDESAKKLYDNLREQRFYDQIISSNITQRVTIDSVSIDLRFYPYPAVAYLKLVQERATARSTRTLITQVEMLDVNRSDANPNGFLMRNFRIYSTSQPIEETIVR